MAVFNTAAGGASLMTTWLSREFIKTLENELQYYRFCNKNMIPLGNGKVGSVNTFPNPTGSITGLTEGLNTEGEQSMTTTSANVTISEFGEFFPMSTLADYAAVEGSRQELAKRMSYGGRLAIDKKIYSVLDAAVPLTWYSTTTPTQGQSTPPTLLGSASGAAATTIVAAAKQVRAFAAQGHRGIAGHPDGQLALMLSPQAELDLVTEVTTTRNTWVNMNVNVPGQMAQLKTIEGYMGSVYGVACYRSQNNTTVFSAGTTSSYSVTNNYLICDGGLAAMTIKDMQPEVYINEPSSGDIGNPYRNRITIAWHLYFGVAVTGDAAAKRLVRYYTLGQP